MVEIKRKGEMPEGRMEEAQPKGAKRKGEMPEGRMEEAKEEKK
ncbi:MAG: hypothetical protein WCE94_06695 [Candidatus Methanoperedens sp.]